MPQRIEPALTAEEWAADEHGYREIRHGKMIVWQRSKANDPAPMCVRSDDGTPVAVAASSAPALIALANAALPDSDPRKITRERLALLRIPHIAQTSGDVEDYPTNELAEFADALESYLPPV